MSMFRVSQSQDSLRSAKEVLERSRRTVEKSLKRLTESQQLVRDPFHLPWRRAETHAESQQLGD